MPAPTVTFPVTGAGPYGTTKEAAEGAINDAFVEQQLEIDTKADGAATTAALATKADDAATTAALATKADGTATTAALATKADAAATTAALSTKADDAATTAALATKADAAATTAALATKADDAATTAALAEKADTTALVETDGLAHNAALSARQARAGSSGILTGPESVGNELSGAKHPWLHL
ncbi:hypothetical protein O4H53_23865, partial [Sulfitobacter sp. G21635-S1]|uniref:hypothetical protein n=1 Tax=Sulfitobacter sp. G21635-S1 TaxID=3014043 RepID=UPI0022B01F10